MNLAAFIDHTLLKAAATRLEIETLCIEARQHSFWSVCVSPARIADARSFLQGSPIKVCTVIGFPLGANLAATKAVEAAQCLEAGADEIDMVMNIGAAMDGDWGAVEEDIRGVVRMKGKALLKVIFETSYLDLAQIDMACRASLNAGADFVKTSTGFSGSGATIEAVARMRAAVGQAVGVKASGGVRDRETALKMVEAGASRLGTSASVSIVSGGAGTAHGY